VLEIVGRLWEVTSVSFFAVLLISKRKKTSKDRMKFLNRLRPSTFIGICFWTLAINIRLVIIWLEKISTTKVTEFCKYDNAHLLRNILQVIITLFLFLAEWK
jgi:hypothetical protein